MFLLIGCKAENEAPSRSQVEIQIEEPGNLTLTSAPRETGIIDSQDTPPVLAGSLDEEPTSDSSTLSSGGIITGAGNGGGPHVRTFENMVNVISGFPFDPLSETGVRVAAAQLTNDAIADIIVAEGAKLDAQVRFINGADGSLMRRVIVPYPGFGGGVFVAAADLNNDGLDDVITGADSGGGSHVRVFSSLPADDNKVLLEFFAYEADFRGGVRVAAGDVDGDGQIEIITTPGPGRAPTVRVFDGTTGELKAEFNNNGNSTLGLNVSTGDVDGNGDDEIIIGLDAGQLPMVLVYDFIDEVDNQRFKVIGLSVVYDPEFSGGVRVAASDLNGDGKAEIITGAGIGGGPHIRAIEFATGKIVQDFFAYDANFRGGVYVSGL